MGGRGSASGISAKGIKYGEEYKTIIEYENIKFIRRNDGSATAPLDTMSALKNRIYVLVNNKNVIKSITFYDKSGKRNREIHFKPHYGKNPHAHDGYDTPHTPETSPLSNQDYKIINKVFKIWEKR